MEGIAERTNGCYLDVCGTSIPAVNTFFLIHWGTQRLMEHESGIFLGVVWLSHAPVWRGAAGDAGMRLRPTGHAERAWANSGVNIYGSNWRTAQQGISYISVLCSSVHNILTFSGERRQYLYAKGLFKFCTAFTGLPLILILYIVHFIGHIFIDWMSTKLTVSDLACTWKEHVCLLTQQAVAVRHFLLI